MYKIGIMFAVLMSGLYASENPFAVEQNVKKIDQDENMLVRAIEKEQAAREKEEDALFDEEVTDEKMPDEKMPDSKIEEETQPSESAAVKSENQEAQTEKHGIEEPDQPSEKVIETPKTTEVAEVSQVTEVTEVTEVKQEEEKVEESLPVGAAVVSPAENTQAKAEVEEAKKEIQPETEEKGSQEEETKDAATKIVVADTIPVVSPKTKIPQESVVPKTEESAELNIREVDAKIKKLQENLDATQPKGSQSEQLQVKSDKKLDEKADENTDEKSATSEEPVAELNATEEEEKRNFLRELQEAIESVRG